jgi:hypothetical protein
MLTYYYLVLTALLLGPLVFEPSVAFQATCRDFVVNHIFDNLSEEEPEDEDGMLLW